MKRKNIKNFEDHVDIRMNTTDDDAKFNLGDRTIAQKYDKEISNQIIEKQKVASVPRVKALDSDTISPQKYDEEISSEIIGKRKVVDVPRIKALDIDKIRLQKGDVEISNEIVENIKIEDRPHMGILSWIGGIILLFWAIGLIFSIGGFMINWLFLIAAVIFIVDMISGKSRRKI